LLFQAALLAFAIRVHLIIRTAATSFLMWAIVCYVIAASSWYTFNFAAGFVLKSAAQTPNARLTVADYRYYSDQTFQILVAALTVAALISFIREHSAGGARGYRPNER